MMTCTRHMILQQFPSNWMKVSLESTNWWMGDTERKEERKKERMWNSCFINWNFCSVTQWKAIQSQSFELLYNNVTSYSIYNSRFMWTYSATIYARDYTFAYSSWFGKSFNPGENVCMGRNSAYVLYNTRWKMLLPLSEKKSEKNRSFVRSLLTLPHCLHFPFSVRRCIQWCCVVRFSPYCRMLTSRNDGLHDHCARFIINEMQLVWATIRHAEHFMRGPCLCVGWKLLVVVMLFCYKTANYEQQQQQNMFVWK